MSAEGRLREDATACLMAAIRAVEPTSLVSGYLSGSYIGTTPVSVVAIGKAAGTMTIGAHEALGDAIRAGVVILPDGVQEPSIPGVEVYRGGHPIPNEEGHRGAEAILRLANGLGSDDVLLCLISGGGSALMTLPPEGVSLADLRATTDLLLRAGATIHELNCVRKHLDRLKGGQLAAVAAPARVTGLILSDVCGDPLDVIASGPLSPDPTTFGAAIRILTTRGLWERVPESIRKHLTAGLEELVPETPGEGDPAFERVEVRVIGSNRIAAEAAMREAETRGYQVRLLAAELVGEAREVGKVLAAAGREAQRSGSPVGTPGCIVSAGETTVTVVGDGRGGRNQELALGAASLLAGVGGIVVGSIGTDGIDGPTDAAGAVVSGTTVERAAELGFDVGDALVRNDAYPLLEAVGDLLITGPTGTNVMDVQVVLVGR